MSTNILIARKTSAVLYQGLAEMASYIKINDAYRLLDSLKIQSLHAKLGSVGRLQSHLTNKDRAPETSFLWSAAVTGCNVPPGTGFPATYIDRI